MIAVKFSSGRQPPCDCLYDCVGTKEGRWTRILFSFSLSPRYNTDRDHIINKSENSSMSYVKWVSP